MSWTERNLSILREGWAAGKSASQIAREIMRPGITRNAVIGKAGRLGLTKHPTSKDTKMANGIDVQRAGETVARLSNDAVLMVQQATDTLNAITMTRAMQAGYRMACEDFGLPVPDMEDPGAAFGL